MATHPVLSKLKDASLFIQQGFIDGSWVMAQTGKTFDVVNPATDERLGACPDFSVDETKRAIDAAADAFPAFRDTKPRERARLLRRWYDLVMDNVDDLAVLLTLENGKPLAEARGEVVYAASFLEWFSEEAPRVYGDTVPASNSPGNSQVLTVREPVGVCALITPWNFPAAMITRKAGAALAAGCTAIIKPAGETPFTANALVELARRAGMPRGVLNVVTASQAQTPAVGAALTSSPRVHKVSFTGSTAVGQLLMQQCAGATPGGTLKKVSLELGGNAPFIVFDDADLEAAVDGAIISKFRASGQTCVCANRLYVQAGIYDAFAARLAARVRREFVVGNGSDARTTHGPLIHGRAAAKAESHVVDAVAKGARVLVGGVSPETKASAALKTTSFVLPTVLTDVTPGMKIASEETFGPVAGLFRFSSEAEALQLANSTPYGLAAYVFSRDVHRAWRVARSLDVGMVGLNTGIISDAAAPFGGVKSSGFGREGSKYGIEEYMSVKTITLGAERVQSRL
ncbi:succinate semialdehyde dehydrogenase NADP+ linked [Sporothrix curviconia]|uniref:Succinate-semialdehyde dehydrogenase n=1 Tax=Sporothrix curviconia TaxID=1260050 RepID=A0ABP0C0I7_9PEZI